jgi:hypothetical protein
VQRKTVYMTCLVGVGLLLVGILPASAGINAAPSISVDDVTVDEDIGIYSFDVELSQPTDVDVTVDAAYAGESAGMGQDFNPPLDTEVTIYAGDTLGYAAFEIVDDALYEPSETFTVALQDAVNATIGDGNGRATILDNDPPPTPAFLVSDGTASEGAGTVQLNMTLSSPSNDPVRVDVVTSDGTATAGSDYVAISGYVYFPPGVTAKTIVLQLKEDALDEPDETYFFNLSNPQGAAIGDGQATITIVDNDLPRPTLSVADVVVMENAGTARMVVTLSHAYTQPVGVAVSTVDQTALVTADYSALSGTITFAPGVTQKTVELSIVDDASIEDQEAFLLHLASPTNGTIADADATVTIIDDDEATPVNHSRTISFELRRHLIAKGTVATDDDFAGCNDQVEVKIQRRRSSGWYTYETVMTESSGKFRTEINDKHGRYRARVVQLTLESGSHICEAATSRSINHQHE